MTNNVCQLFDAGCHFMEVEEVVAVMPCVCLQALQRVLEVIPFTDLEADFSRFGSTALGEGATGMVVIGMNSCLCDDLSDSTGFLSFGPMAQ